ncbi:hypothetical protein HII12_001480 [Brettanomyces bruxellensis]|uniref:C2H2-type domain-containing protein n=1 Tax=Dekkera bruxellensis TaxID=5007 RepID=A0A8H6EXP9_DEKBR|nr:hypothetical protein HII12_001480 [Brettanomyces bruxellensis]
MQILDSLKVDSADKLQDEEFIRGLDSAKVISKLLLSVYTLEGEVSKLKDQIGEYGRLNKLLDLEDVSSAETGKTKPEPTTVQGITLGDGGSSGVGAGNGSSAPNGRIPVGFTPMYGSPVISGDQVAPGGSEGEESDTGALQQRFVRPWPEVTLNQLASRFKIPRDLLSKTAKRLGASKELDDSNLKPIRAADIDGRARRGAVGRPRKHPGRPGRPHRGPGRPRKSRSRSPAVQSGRGDRGELRGVPGGEPRGVKREPGAPATADRAPDSKKSRLPSVSTLNYSVTRDLKYKCDSCGEIFHNYMQLYWHKRSEHPHELVGEAGDASVASANGSISASFTPGAPFRSSSDASIDVRPQPVSRGRPIGISIGGGSLTPYYSRSPDGSYSCSLCRRKPFTSYHGIYAHLRSVHYDAETDRYWKDGPRHSEAERGDESDRDEGVAASDGNIGNEGSTASDGNIRNDGSTTNDGNIGNARSVRNVGNIGNVRSVGNIGNVRSVGNVGSTANVEVEGTPNAGTANIGSNASAAVATTESTQGTGSNGNIGSAAITNGTANDEIVGTASAEIKGTTNTEVRDTTNTEVRDTTNTEVRDTTNTEVKGTEPPSQNEHHANSHTANIQVAVKHETVRDIPLEDIHTLNTHPGSHALTHPSQNSNPNTFSSFSGVLNPDTSKISQSAPQQTPNLPANTPHINNGSDSTSFPSSITATAVSDSLSSPPDATAVKSRLQSDLKDVFKA